MDDGAPRDTDSPRGNASPNRQGLLNARYSSNMYQSPSGYIFRLKIPKDIKPIVSGKIKMTHRGN